jgi:predicted molibdopterin-dependent oxidoreductase YjgC
LMRRSDGTLAEASWDEALSFVSQRMLDIKAKHGPDALAAISSSRCTNEENYLLQRLTRAGLNTNSIDHCART